MKSTIHAEEALIKLFGSTSRARILVFLFSNSSQAFYQREIVFETGLSLQAVQRELGNLVELGIVKKNETNSRVYYQLNSSSPFVKPLTAICRFIHEE
jgi:predicted transcriptional regulator